MHGYKFCIKFPKIGETSNPYLLTFFYTSITIPTCNDFYSPGVVTINNFKPHNDAYGQCFYIITFIYMCCSCTPNNSLKGYHKLAKCFLETDNPS